MALPQILTAGEQPLHQPWRLVAAAVDSVTGALTAGDTLTAALYDPANNLWWNATSVEWQAGREDNAMAELGGGFYSLSFDPASLGASEVDYAVVVATAAPSTSTMAVKFRHDLRHTPVLAASAPAVVQTLGDLANLLSAWFSCSIVVDDDAKQLVVYQSDGVTPAIQFDLNDAGGVPSAMDPFQRIRA